MSNLRRNRLTAAVHLTLLLALPGIAAAQEQAPDGDANSLDTITVTGTRIKRVDAETSSPVYKIDRQAIEATGAMTIGQFIQQVPSVSGAATNPAVNNGGGTGEAYISLRGLNEDRTLILINGHRVVSKDVNAIPMAMIENVEILKDGASAIYGSDAIGGVVNFITKKNFDGTKVQVDYGVAGEGDGERRGANATLGISGDRGNVIINAGWHRQDEIRASDRKFSAFALTLSSGVVTVGGSSRGLTGRYAVPESVVGLDCNGNGSIGTNLVGVSHNVGATTTNPLTDFHCFGSADLFNYQGVGNLELTPQERGNVFISGNYDLTDNVQGYLDYFVNKTRSASQIAPLPFDGRPQNDNVVISRNSIYNPFGVDITDSRLRLAAIGNRRYNFSTDTSQMTLGFRGGFGDTTWLWDVAGSYGRIEQDQKTEGYLRSADLVAALGPSFIDGTGTPRCGTVAAPIAGCIPLNFINVPINTSTPAGQAAQAALNAIAVNSRTFLRQSFRNFEANTNGDLFETSAGTVKAAFGLAYADYRLNFSPDALTRYEDLVNFTCDISSEACASQTSGDYNVKEVYGEVFWPLLKDVAWAKSLNLTFGSRYSKYSTFGNTTNSKLGLEWRPSDQLLVRGTIAQVFRAPTINDLYRGLYTTSDGFTDPCNGYNGALNANPGCQNVPTGGGFRQSDTQLSGIHGGTSTLNPEEGHVVTWGMVYEPSWLDNFSASMDVWRVHLNDTIGNYGASTILQQCARSTLAAPSAFCTMFSRDSTGEVFRLFDRAANIGTTDTNGVDLGIKYRFETPWGKIRASLDTTYTAEYNVNLIGPDGKSAGTQHLAGTFLSPANGGLGNYSRWRGLGVLGWSLGNWDAQWTSRYVHGFQVGSNVPGTIVPCADAGTSAPTCELNYGATTYHNLEGSWGYKPWGLKVRLGVDNVFDKQPPILFQNNTLNGNVDERTFDTIGRYFWTSVSFDF